MRYAVSPTIQLMNAIIGWAKVMLTQWELKGWSPNAFCFLVYSLVSNARKDIQRLFVFHELLLLYTNFIDIIEKDVGTSLLIN